VCLVYQAVTASLSDRMHPVPAHWTWILNTLMSILYQHQTVGLVTHDSHNLLLVSCTSQIGLCIAYCVICFLIRYLGRALSEPQTTIQYCSMWFVYLCLLIMLYSCDMLSKKEIYHSKFKICRCIHIKLSTLTLDLFRHTLTHPHVYWLSIPSHQGQI